MQYKGDLQYYGHYDSPCPYSIHTASIKSVTTLKPTQQYAQQVFAVYLHLDLTSFGFELWVCELSLSNVGG